MSDIHEEQILQHKRSSGRLNTNIWPNPDPVLRLFMMKNEAKLNQNERLFCVFLFCLFVCTRHRFRVDLFSIVFNDLHLFINFFNAANLLIDAFHLTVVKYRETKMMQM